MAAKSDDLYGTYGGVATVQNEGGGGTPMGVRANPQDFGSGIGQAISGVGQQAEQISEQFQKMAVEAKANDVIANQWAPTVADLSGQYLQKQGQDAINGLGEYQQKLTNLHNDFLENASSPYERQILSGYMSKHVSQEMGTAMRHQVGQIGQFEEQSSNAFLGALHNNAVTNFNNPDVVNSTLDQMNAQIEKHAIDKGIDPNSEAGRSIIDNQQRIARGGTVQSMIGRAVAAGDTETANRIYADNRDYIPGHNQLEIDKMLHSENMSSIGAKNYQALVSGAPIHPPTVIGGQIAQQARAATADAASVAGVEANHALTVLRIESSDGTNLGKRGDIGQTGKGGTLQEQAMNLATELKRSDDIATKALGRASEPWEGYVCYQQGSGGGPALLKAAQDSPTARAVDVLNPLYNNSKDALSAVVNNGGNATMTSGQFLDFIKQKYTAQAARASTALPVANAAPVPDPVNGAVTQTAAIPQSLSAAILAPSQTVGVPLQPGANPIQSLDNLNKIYPDALMRANQIPNLDERKATIQALEQNHALYQAAASAYDSNLNNQIKKVASDPNYTSFNQVPPDLRTAIADNPERMDYLKKRAEENLYEKSGVVSKDAGTYGSGFHSLFTAIHPVDQNAPRLTDVSQIYKAYNEGILNVAGVDKLVKELGDKGDNAAEAAMKSQTFDVIKMQLSGKDFITGMTDPKGEAIYAHALPLIYKALDEGKAKGIPIGELYDPESKNWIGNATKGMKRTPQQFYADMAEANMGDSKELPKSGNRSLQDIIFEVKAGKLSPEAGRAEAQKLGLVAANNKQPVPFPKE